MKILVISNMIPLTVTVDFAFADRQNVITVCVQASSATNWN